MTRSSAVLCLAIAGSTLAAWEASPRMAYASSCVPIRFEPGRTSASVTGIAPAEDTVCYSLTTRAGQKATLKIVHGDNTIFTVDGVVDAQNSFTFVTRRQTYQVLVGQLMRAVDTQTFELSVVVK